MSKTPSQDETNHDRMENPFTFVQILIKRYIEVKTCWNTVTKRVLLIADKTNPGCVVIVDTPGKFTLSSLSHANFPDSL